MRTIVQTLRPIQHITVRIAGQDDAAADLITPTAQAILTAPKTSPH